MLWMRLEEASPFAIIMENPRTWDGFKDNDWVCTLAKGVALNTQTPTIIWTWTDEAPALATLSFLPIVEAFAHGTGIALELWDISLAGRILANFPDFLSESQKIPDYLSRLGELTLLPEANIIKLPNISASIPQLSGAIRELQTQGYRVPDYPESPKNEAELDIQVRYSRVLGSAVNPVIRQGNSDRRSPASVKEYARKHPIRMGAWSSASKTRVAHMTRGDFYESEQSRTIPADAVVRYEFVDSGGAAQILKADVPLSANCILDTSVMHVQALREFYAEQIAEAKAQGVLLSLHLKATMMKVSDPVLFGHAVSVYYQPVLEKHAAVLRQIGFNPDNGIGDLLAKLHALPPATKDEIESDIKSLYQERPALAMVDSERGITNLHLPNLVIIDASMPAMIRDSGKMWGPDGNLDDTRAMLPDRCYSTMYQAIIEDCQAHGAFDQSTMGSVPNVGLMAQEAEEYGSHDKTFIAAGPGRIRVVNQSTGETLLEQTVQTGDVFRSCRTTDASVRDWVKLTVQRAGASRTPAVFWLDRNRAHDREIIAKVVESLKEHDTAGLDIQILDPVEAMRVSLARIRKGEDTISVGGNVVRDYLTDLFPILEIGTSGKVYSIVPLLAGGGLFETGAGGSAPKHVQQFQKENYLRWDSLGEFLGLEASLDHLAGQFRTPRAALLAKTLDLAIGKLLDMNKSPARKVGEIDNRGSHFYLAMYWAEALAAQSEDPEIQARFAAVAKKLSDNEARINAELMGNQRKPVDMGGYYHPDMTKTAQAMRPSPTLNAIIDTMLS
jgi:isocitrate dehydrogenase